MKNIYDSIVIGLGGSGSSCLYQLSKSGRNVLGIERFNINHKNGSSHGDSRIIRQAYFEGEYYVPFAKRAYKIWDKLEKENSIVLFNRVGCLNIGTKEDQLVEKCKFSADKYDLKYELLNNIQINKNYSHFKIPDEYYSLLEYNAGFLYPEKCIESFIKCSKSEIKTNIYVKKIKYDEGIYEIITNDYESYYSKEIVISIGSWANQLLSNFNIKLPFTIDLNHIFYYDIPGKNEEFPVYIISNKNFEFYGFPNLNGNGYKISLYHQHNNYKNIEEVDREIVNLKNLEIINDSGNKFIKNFENAKLLNKISCLYTSTPDKDFIIDYIPNHPSAILISACSGHGFKFTAAIGEEALFLLDKKKDPIEQFKISKYINY